jgi:hypothetical protein
MGVIVYTAYEGGLATIGNQRQPNGEWPNYIDDRHRLCGSLRVRAVIIIRHHRRHDVRDRVPRIARHRPRKCAAVGIPR